ncbi:MAG: glycosyltransferase [Cyclobacteriaceae bacterium]
MPKRFHQRAINNILDQFSNEQGTLKLASSQTEIFSSPKTGFAIERNSMVHNSDVVNLHWVSNYINYESFFKEVKKPMVWTLHDLNILHGGYHFDIDIQDSAEISALDLKYKNIKRDAIRNCDITFVAPSKWLKNRLLQDDFFKNYQVRHIPYGVDTNLYRPMSKSVAREVLNLESDKKYLLIAAHNQHIERKGFKYLSESIDSIYEDSNVEFVSVGNTNYNEKVTFLGYISDPFLMKVIYNAVDGLVFPSIEDNLPNIVLEALACGTPVICFNQGGMPDMVIDEENGFIADSLTGDDLLKKIRRLLNTKELDRNRIREITVQNYSLDRQAKGYLDLYAEVGT